MTMSGRTLAARLVGVAVGCMAGLCPAGEDLGRVGRFAKWARIEIRLTGPASGAAGRPNPFSVLVDATFTSPAGRTVTVPGFYDGDGRGGLDGAVWKVRFAADETGTWRFASRSAEPRLNGRTGTFEVVAAAAGAKGFWKWGRLEYVGKRYLKFRDGPYWLKAGCDDPENFLGRFRHYDTLAKRRAAVDYLAARGINSLYIMTHNIGGDHKDVWPWLGASAEQARRNAGADARFDCAKLAKWLAIFEHMQARGVACYLVLEDDSAWTGFDRRRYYRELIARFAHLPAVLFNIGEEHEESYKTKQALAFAALVKELDPYDHPVGIHNVNRPSDAYVDAAAVDFTAIQTKRSKGDATYHNALTIAWIERCRSRKARPLMVGFDEPRPLLDRTGWWSAYLAGGVWEAHTGQPYDVPPSAHEPAWTQLGYARAFMETLPFWEMAPRNDLVRSGKAFCLAKPGETYAAYVVRGGKVSLDLTGAKGPLAVDWFDPRTGRFAPANRADGGAVRAFQAPGDGDWALRIRRQGAER